MWKSWLTWCLWPIAGVLSGQEDIPKQEQFLYRLQLVPRLQHNSAWTEADNQAIQAHLAYLQDLLDKGRLLLAGRTDEAPEKTFGIVVFEAVGESEARSVMENDPAVKNGLMTATLHPFRIALIRQ